MSTEQEPLHSGSSDAFDDCKASRVEVEMSELPAQELDGDKQEGLPSSSAGELGTTKEQESDVKKTKESRKKEVSVNGEEVNGEKDSGGIQKEEEPEKKQGTKAEDLDEIECFVGLEPYVESKNECPLDNNENTPPVRSKVKLSESDLVWAKVRSHPWWPGQVFDASAATDKAKKHFKKGSFLVTYFGDCSFAWNDATKIKPFRQHFSQLAKQSSLPDFLDAVEFALEEVSRRIEFGLACACVPEEVYERVKTQKVINPGIREESSRVHGGDKVSSAAFFEPKNLVEYVKGLACSPRYDASDELQFVSERARLLAFNRWKGYTDLPEFETLKGSVESAPKMKESVPELKKSKQVYTKKRKTEDKDGCKGDGVFEYEDTTVLKKKYEDITVLKKKEKTLAEFIAEIRLSKSNVKKSDIKPDGEKKRKVVHEKVPKSAKKMKTNLQTEDSGSPVSPKSDQKITPKKAKTSFGIGASILRVANQMHCSAPTGLVPCSKNSGKSLQDRRKPDALSDRDPSPTATKTPNGKGQKTPSTDPVEDSLLEVRNLKGSEEQMENEDGKEAANIEGEMTIEDKTTGPVLKDQPLH